jgi:hypothetical protein
MFIFPCQKRKVVILSVCLDLSTSSKRIAPLDFLIDGARLDLCHVIIPGFLRYAEPSFYIRVQKMSKAAHHMDHMVFRNSAESLVYQARAIEQIITK